MRSLLLLAGLWVSTASALECRIEERNHLGWSDAYALSVEVAASLEKAVATEVIAPARVSPELRLDLFAYRAPDGRVTASASVIDSVTLKILSATGRDGEVSLTYLDPERVVLISCR
jgi:hypothetical protein